MKNEKGYTLLELIIVIAIIGTMTGVVVLSTGFLGRSRVNSAFNLIQSGYSTARNNKMTKQRAGSEADLTISYDPVEKTYYCQVRGEDRKQLLTAPYTISFLKYSNSETSDIGSEVTFEALAAEMGTENTVSFTFDRSGALKAYDEDTQSYVSGICVESRKMYIIFETGKYSLTEPDFGS